MHLKILTKKRQNGFGLITSIFILAGLALISSFVISISNISHSTSSLSFQGMRAYFAAKSGLEWGIQQVVATPTICPPTTNLNLNQAGLNGFSVQVTCSFIPITEGVTTFNIFQITAFSSYSTYGNIDYASRQMQVFATLGN